ncbi:uncharacterized protein [Henckelia pumila]|uniref:uncharacterized protein n=1 Tax=Henckelia pumila TaxID=405737 RepID=UPI003C6E9C19
MAARRGRPPLRPPPPPPPPPHADVGTQVLACLARILERHVDAPRPGLGTVYEQFRKMNPKNFAGTTDPLVAEGWIRSFEVIFRYMKLGDPDRVHCAVFHLQDDAALWWEGVEKTGDLSVAEFVVKFERGCHFVPLIGDDKAEKLQHFIVGLRPTIRRDVLMAEPADYASALRRALRSEQTLRDISAEAQSKRPFPSHGRILISGVATRALLDSGATHSFISEAFTRKRSIECEDLIGGFIVTIPSGEELSTRRMVRNLELLLQGQPVVADLIVLPMPEFDLILGMDWMTKNAVVIDFQLRSVLVRPEGVEPFQFEATRGSRRTQFISFMQAKQMVHEGCEAFLASISLTELPPRPDISDVDIVRDFEDVFPDDVAGIPPDREVEFSIELVPGTVPISKAPYRLAPMEMRELKEQIQEIEDLFDQLQGASVFSKIDL